MAEKDQERLKEYSHQMDNKAAKAGPSFSDIYDYRPELKEMGYKMKTVDPDMARAKKELRDGLNKMNGGGKWY